MQSTRSWLIAVIACLAFALQPARALEGSNGSLVSAQVLQRHLGNPDLVILDASPAKAYAVNHIPGAINVDVFAFGARDASIPEIEQRYRSWGIGPGKKVVIYDQGGGMTATWLFFDLYYHGVPAGDLLVLDGGLAKWREVGGTVTQEPTAAPAPGSFRVSAVVEDARVRLPQFLVASGDPANHALVEALEPEYHFGERKFFDRAGHVPNAIMMPHHDFYNADKTFKSPAELRRMLAYYGIRPEQQIHAHCGGGVAATVPFFAFRFIVGLPRVALYRESQLEWLRDDRGLPFWTYDAPTLMRDMHWLNGWGSRMMRMFGVAGLSVIDVRSEQAYGQGHVPFSLNIPSELFRAHLAAPEKLADLLGASGVDAAHEAVIVSERGLNEQSALAFLMLEKLGQKKVSILIDSLDDWALQGMPITRERTVVGPKRSPQDVAIAPTSYPVRLLANVATGSSDGSKGAYPKVVVDSGKAPAAGTRDGKVVHVPYVDLLTAGGVPRPAKDIWRILSRAGVPRYAEIVLVADEPGAAAVNYFILRLMGYPDVRVRLS